MFEEIDDGLSISDPTQFPSLTNKENDQISNNMNSTEIPDSKQQDEKKLSTSSVIGRTFSDLIFESLNNLKVITIILLFSPFPFFASNISCFKDMKYPLVIGIGLTTVWYTSSIIKWIISKLNKS